jgi:multidrug resistance efflux pump
MISRLDMKNHRLELSLTVVALAALLLAGCGQDSGQADGESAEATAIPAVSAAADVVTAEGQLVPLRSANLSFQLGGTVDEILVSEGDRVAEGDPLIRLDADNVEVAQDQALAGLAAAEAQLDSTMAQLATAQAGVSTAELGVLAAEANLALVKAGALPEEIASAEQRIRAAEAGITQAAASRDAALDIPDSQIQGAQANVAAAQAEVDALQDGYNAIIDACFELPTGDEVCPLYGTVEENTRAELETARLRLNSAQAALDALNAGATTGQRQAASGGVSVAMANRDLAEAELALLLAGPTEEQIRQAEVQVDQAGALVEQAQTAVEQSRAAVEQAEAGVLSAQASVDGAEAALERMTLRAVFPGTIGDVGVDLGQLVTPGLPVVVLADLGGWQVETNDLSQDLVTGVRVGDPVEVTLEAIPGEVLSGTVSDIARVSQLRRGDVIYVVTIELEERPDLPLRWGMTAIADIDVG